MTDRELMNMAREASMNAYIPYSHFAVGAALECMDGSEGKRSFRRIAIYADSENWCTPCGACRQFLAEFSPDMEVLCAKAGARYVSYKLSELLPHTFSY